MKALLVELPLERWHELFPNEQFVGITPRSLTFKRFTASERTVSECGNATNFEESEADVSAISAAIRDCLSQPRASLTVSAPSIRLSEELVAPIAAATMRAAAKIGKLLA